MSNIICIVKKNFKQLFRKKLNIFIYLILPVLITSVIFGLTSTASNGKYPMGVVDKDQSVITQDMLKYLEKTNKFQIIELNESEADEKVISRKVSFVLSIPKDFAKSIMNGEGKNIDIISIQGKQSTIYINQFVNMYVNNLRDIYTASGGNPELYQTIYDRYQKGKINFEATFVQDKSVAKSSTVTSMGIFIMIILSAATTTSGMLLQEKRDKTFYRISTSPVKSYEIVLANVIVNVLIVTIQISFVLFMITKVFNINMFIPVFQLFIILVAFGFAAVGIGMLIMAFSKSSASAGALGTFIITPSCMLAGCFWPRSIMPKFLQRASLFLPQSWVMDFIDKIQVGKPFAEVRINIVITLLFAVVFFLIAAYKIKQANENDEFI